MAAPALLPAGLGGHARLYGQRNSVLGEPAKLTLYGTAEEPQLYADDPDKFGGISVRPRPADLIRFAREVLAFLGEGYGVTLPPWRPANNGTGKRIWFLLRDGCETDQSIPLADRYHYGRNGNLVRYASQATAQRAADRLNAQEQENWHELDA
jgi:hypothetical protein